MCGLLLKIKLNAMQKKYRIETLVIPTVGQVVPSNCNDITFINFGDYAQPPAGDVLIVDDVIHIKPGQQYIITGNEGEVNVTNHRCYFRGSSGVRTAVVARKIIQ